jgi:hypothetical protein
MSHELAVPSQIPVRPCMGRACHENTWPGRAHLPACERETKAVAHTPITSNGTIVSMTPSRRLDLFPATADKPPNPTENSIRHG